MNRLFYRYEPPEPLEVIEADIKTLEGENSGVAAGSHRGLTTKNTRGG